MCDHTNELFIVCFVLSFIPIVVHLPLLLCVVAWFIH